MHQDPIKSYLALMEAQATPVFSALPAIGDHLLWVRPSQDEWSPGEHLSHIAVVHRFFRRVSWLLWPIASLFARARTGRAFETTIDDIYARPGFPHAIGRLWPPEYSPRRPASAELLMTTILREHRLVRGLYEARHPTVLAQAPLYFPSLGWINYIQSLRIAVFHDAHHFEQAQSALSAATPVNKPVP